MMEGTAVVRKWGRSNGMVIANSRDSHERLKPGDRVRYLVVKENNVFRKTFGMDKFDRPVSKILKKANKGAWDD